MKSTFRKILFLFTFYLNFSFFINFDAVVFNEIFFGIKTFDFQKKKCFSP